MKVTPEDINEYIRQGLECDHLKVEGDGRHFDAVIVSREFEGKGLLQRQRLVFGVLGDRMEKIHALTLKTLTPQQWAEQA